MLSKGSFIFIEYNGVPYPEGYSAQIHEVAGHLDKDTIHTEYSYGKRTFDSGHIAAFPILCEANKDGVPQLWKSDE